MTYFSFSFKFEIRVGNTKFYKINFKVSIINYTGVTYQINKYFIIQQFNSYLHVSVQFYFYKNIVNII